MAPLLSGVSKTAILTLRARADEHKLRDRLFEDPLAVKWYAEVEWPVELSHWYNSWVQTKLVFRVDQIDRCLKKRLAELSGATVVELGCGLSTRYYRMSAASSARWIDLDLPDMIKLREALGVGGDDHRHVASSVLEYSWFDTIEEKDARKIVFIAEGLFYYLPRADVERLFQELRRRFAHATIIFDVIGAQDLKPSIATSSLAGTPILWAVDPPFEKAMADFGVETIAGLEPEALLEEMFDRFQRRFGSAMRFIVKSLTRVPRFRNHRSGVMIGKLAPLPS